MRVDAGLGIAADGEEKGIDGGEIAGGVEDDECEQRAASDVQVCSRVSSCVHFAPGGH